MPASAPATQPTCPRCRRPTGLLLDRPVVGAYNPVYRCDGRAGGCGFLWSPADRDSRAVAPAPVAGSGP